MLTRLMMRRTRKIKIKTTRKIKKKKQKENPTSLMMKR